MVYVLNIVVVFEAVNEALNFCCCVLINWSICIRNHSYVGRKQSFPDRYHVTVRVSPKYKWRLAEEYGADSFELTPEGDCVFSAGFTDRDHLLSWILSFQGEAELLEPADLREELAKIGETISRKHHT